MTKKELIEKLIEVGNQTPEYKLEKMSLSELEDLLVNDFVESNDLDYSTQESEIPDISDDVKEESKVEEKPVTKEEKPKEVKLSKAEKRRIARNGK